MSHGKKGVVKKAVIPAAGMGTRFLPATKALPKEMLPIIDRPIIQYVIEEAIAAGIEDIIIVTGRGKRAMEDYFDRSLELEYFLQQKGQLEPLDMVRKISNLADIHYVRQKEPLGLGHAIYQAKRHVNDKPFAVLLGDEIFKGPEPAIKQLIECYRNTVASILAVRPVEDKQVSKYGIIRPQKEGRGLIKVLELIEKPPVDKAPSNLAIVGRYIIEPQIFDILETLPPGHNGEIQLTDALQVMSGTRDIFAAEIRGSRYDVGDVTGYLQATVKFALERNDLSETFRKFLLDLKLPGGKKFC
ncbi:MAG: UTP--glucose-1-phosphate uridylyltransferase GalU [Bacillota bacterium]